MNSTAFGFKGAGIEDDGLDERQAPFAAVPVSQGGSFPGIPGASLAFETTTPKWSTPGRDAELEPSLWQGRNARGGVKSGAEPAITLGKVGSG
jgi:hypothetical protein